jgi:hypothetical protein
MIATLLTFLMAATTTLAFSESGPGNGTDYVKVLFADAQYEANRSLAPLESTQSLSLDPTTRRWLDEQQGDSTRFTRLKSYLRKIELRFQQDPCSDESRLPASICFYNEDPANPYVIVSLGENKLTSKDQAVAMLLHEAGHFTGEKDHLFLDRMGVQLAQALKAPSFLIADAESSEVVSNIFAAKDGCDRGTSAQALALAQRLKTDLRLQCGGRPLGCNVEKAQLLFQGSTSLDRGGSFDMKVRCAARAVLDLRT